VKGNDLLYKNSIEFVLKMKYEFNKYNGSYMNISNKVVYNTDYECFIGI